MYVAGMREFGITLCCYVFFPEELKTYPGLSHLYGGGIEILTIGNGEALNNTQITTKN